MELFPKKVTAKNRQIFPEKASSFWLFFEYTYDRAVWLFLGFLKLGGRGHGKDSVLLQIENIKNELAERLNCWDLCYCKTTLEYETILHSLMYKNGDSLQGN